MQATATPARMKPENAGGLVRPPGKESSTASPGPCDPAEKLLPIRRSPNCRPAACRPCWPKSPSTGHMASAKPATAAARRRTTRPGDQPTATPPPGYDHRQAGPTAAGPPRQLSTICPGRRGWRRAASSVKKRVTTTRHRPGRRLQAAHATCWPIADAADPGGSGGRECGIACRRSLDEKQASVADPEGPKDGLRHGPTCALKRPR